ncbi:MAG: hypothetical protein ACREQN_02785 [Candidatus Binataceae bacterium]
MVTPTLFASLVGIALIAMLAAADWYVWRSTYAADFRDWPRVRPLSGAELGERVLAHLEKVNWAVLPWSALQPPRPVVTAEEREGHGFKKVA